MLKKLKFKKISGVTMLDLYHHGSSVCAAKVRFALAAKNVAVDNAHYLDILNGEQFTEEYRKINPLSLIHI